MDASTVVEGFDGLERMGRMGVRIQKHMNEKSHFLWLFSCTNVDNGIFLSEATVLVAKRFNRYIS